MRSSGEFDLIARYFTEPSQALVTAKGIPLGIGDDCAILPALTEGNLATSIDTLVAGVHFNADCAPSTIAWRGLATAVSDLAAMGAQPIGFTLALSLPAADPEWLTKFSDGLHAASKAFDIALIGGDTTRNNTLTLSFSVFGRVSGPLTMRRNNAQVNDFIVVSGELGDANLGLSLLEGDDNDTDSLAREFLVQRYYKPQPRLILGYLLNDLANSCIDISDGLLADLGHICETSAVSAEIFVEQLPISAAAKALFEPERYWQAALSGGDDYELCFTLPPAKLNQLQELATQISVPLTVIGRITPDEQPIKVLNNAQDQLPWLYESAGFSHF